MRIMQRVKVSGCRHCCVHRVEAISLQLLFEGELFECDFNLIDGGSAGEACEKVPGNGGIRQLFAPAHQASSAGRRIVMLNGFKNEGPIPEQDDGPQHPVGGPDVFALVCVLPGLELAFADGEASGPVCRQPAGCDHLLGLGLCLNHQLGINTLARSRPLKCKLHRLIRDTPNVVARPEQRPALCEVEARWTEVAPIVQKASRFTEAESGVRLYPIPHPERRGLLVGVPGATSVLGFVMDRSEAEVIARWRERTERAQRDPNAGAGRGSRVHAALEDHVRGSAPRFAAPELERPVAQPEDTAYWRKQLDLACGNQDGGAVDRPLRGELLGLAGSMGEGELLERVLRSAEPIMPVEEQPRLLRVLDAAFYSGMPQHLELFDEFLWNERPLVQGWEHLWNVPKGEPDRLARMWSTRWGCAGTPDIIARGRGLTVLSDFKTSTQPYYRCHGRSVPQHKETGWRKYKKTVKQLAGYLIMIEERTDVRIDALQIIVGLPGVNQSQQFIIRGHEIEVAKDAFQRSALEFWRGYRLATAAAPRPAPLGSAPVGSAPVGLAVAG